MNTNHNDRGKYILILFATGLIIFLLVISYVEYPPNNAPKYPSRTYGKPVISAEYPIINVSIEQVVISGEYIYVLLHHANGIVQVYNMDGKYLHSLFFYCHTKGGFSLAVDNECLYVQDMRDNVYAFQNGNFVSFMNRSQAERQLSHLDFRSRTNSAGYSIQNGSVWKESKNGKTMIIKGPSSKSAVHGHIGAAIAILISTIIYFRKRY